METKLDHIIEKIKADGVEQANQQAEEIIKKAKNEADSIVQKANKDAEHIVRDAEKKAADFEEKSKRSLQLAARDTQLLVKEKLTDLFDRAFKKEVSESLDPEFLHKMILNIVENWDESKSAEIVLSEADKKQLEPLLYKSLNKELKDSLTLQVSDHVSGGFRIRLKDGDLYYDLTDENIAEILYLFINPKLKEILESDNG
ncbi:hypothetical protein GF407_20400 [candidate division KSB1 bacterium]|nr:hypothetical protein [candidate division KSB1 bacterium]